MADTTVSATVVGSDIAGNSFSAATTSTHSVDTVATASISVDPITADDIVNAAEASGSVNVTGTVGGDASVGDSVSFDINGTSYSGTVGAGKGQEAGIQAGPSTHWASLAHMAVVDHRRNGGNAPRIVLLGQSLKHAYAHHIQRLMITGNFALLAGVHPDAVDRWYLGIYIDAIQWVELPNTRAMSQFADGGQVATKPYISSAKYIRSMSYYCDTCSYEWKKRHGDMACPFNSLYWDFFNRHRRRLQKNPRIGLMYRTWDRMDGTEKRQVLKQAAAYRKNLNQL